MSGKKKGKEGIKKSDWIFKGSCRVGVVGPSQCGKSELILELLQDRSFFDPPLDGVIYCCMHNFGKRDYMQKMKYICHQNNMSINFLDHIPTGEEIMDDINPEGNKNLVFILEDFLSFPPVQQTILNSLVTEHSHHLNFSLIFVTQTPFDRNLVVANKNLTHRIIFQNFNDGTSLQLINNRVFTGKKNFLKNCLDASMSKYDCNYIILNTDLHSKLPFKNRVYTRAIGESAREGGSPLFFDLDDPELAQ